MIIIDTKYLVRDICTCICVVKVLHLKNKTLVMFVVHLIKKVYLNFYSKEKLLKTQENKCISCSSQLA